MKKELTLVRTLDASRERVWAAWTNPQEVARWWGPNGVTIPTSEIDLRVGGAVYIIMLAGKELGPLAGQRWPMRGIFTEIIEPTKLVFTTSALDDAGAVILSGETTVLLEGEGGKTRLTIKTSVSGDTPAVAQMLQGMEPGWNQQLDKLEQFVR